MGMCKNTVCIGRLGAFSLRGGSRGEGVATSQHCDIVVKSVFCSLY